MWGVTVIFLIDQNELRGVAYLIIYFYYGLVLWVLKIQAIGYSIELKIIRHKQESAAISDD
jgi:hypothetical protein